jgi:hypothetical protein
MRARGELDDVGPARAVETPVMSQHHVPHRGRHLGGSQHALANGRMTAVGVIAAGPVGFQCLVPA